MTKQMESFFEELEIIACLSMRFLECDNTQGTKGQNKESNHNDQTDFVSLGRTSIYGVHSAQKNPSS